MLKITPFQNEYKNLFNELEKLEPTDLEKSIDQGGHGGAIRIKPSIAGKYIFLKPKTSDGTESRNYKILQNDPKISRWMPKVPGEIEIDGKPYLIMENIRKTSSGKNLEQLADIKLAGKVKGLNNPLTSKKEMICTRGNDKSWITKLWMKFVTAIAPNYLITTGGVRLHEYLHSKKILKHSLESISIPCLEKLLADMMEMKKDLEKSEFAFIGASIALIHQPEGRIQPVLIDPAHIACSNKIKGSVIKTLGPEESKKVYFERQTSKGENHYLLYKKSNSIALDSLILTIRKVLLKKTTIYNS